MRETLKYFWRICSPGVEAILTVQGLKQRGAIVTYQALSSGGARDQLMRCACSCTCRPFAGIIEDLKRRAPHYLSDWRDGFHPKVLSATLFMFFTSIAPAITFAAVLSLNTVDEGTGKAQLGPVEVLLSTAVTGSMFAIIGGQPLCIVGVTGPVTIFTLAVFNIAKTVGVPFLPFYGWIQIWSAVMHMVLAVTVRVPGPSRARARGRPAHGISPPP